MRIVRHIIILFLIIIFCPNFISGQENIKEIDGMRYVVHVVEKGNTLYSISKQHNADLNEIMQSNPSLEDGLKPGMELLIPIGLVPNDEERGFSEKDEAPAETSEEAEDYNLDNGTGNVGILIHVVVKGDTKYNLSKKYNVSIEELENLNPDLTEGLKLGQQLKIAVEQNTFDKKRKLTPRKTDTLIVHVVTPLECLSDIARMFTVSIDSILAVNSKSDTVVAAGDTIRIPRLAATKPVIKMTLNEASINWPDSVILKNAYKVALMLPFYLDFNDTLDAYRKPLEKPSIYNKSNIALEFYEGMLIALDSLQKCGFSVSVDVYDTGNDSLTVASIISSGALDSVDMIIGPLYRSQFEMVADAMKGKFIPTICPVPQSNKILLGNIHVVKVSPSTSIQVEYIAQYAAKMFFEENLLLLGSAHPGDEPLIRIAENTINQYLTENNDAENEDYSDSLRAIQLEKFDKDDLRSLLDTTDLNVIVVPSLNQAFVSDLLTQLHNAKTENFEILVLGLDNWKRFDNIDIHYLHDLNVHLVTPQNIDYYGLKSFVLEYRNKFKTDPGKYTFLGYDVSMYFFKMLQEHGSGILKDINQAKNQGLSIGFDFFRTGIESGFENKHVYLLKYQDFELIKIQ